MDQEFFLKKMLVYFHIIRSFIFKRLPEVFCNLTLFAYLIRSKYSVSFFLWLLFEGCAAVFMGLCFQSCMVSTLLLFFFFPLKLLWIICFCIHVFWRIQEIFIIIVLSKILRDSQWSQSILLLLFQLLLFICQQVIQKEQLMRQL